MRPMQGALFMKRQSSEHSRELAPELAVPSAPALCDLVIRLSASCAFITFIRATKDSIGP